MKTLVMFSLSAMVLAGCNGIPEPAVNSALSSKAELTELSPSDVPMYGWEPFDEETFETHTLQGKIFYLPESSSRLRVNVRADSAIFGGALTKETLATFELTHRIFRAADFERMRCSLQSIDREEVTCELDPHEQMAFIVRDARAGGTVTLGVFGLFHPSGKLAERASQPNKIQIELSTWQCLENCKKG